MGNAESILGNLEYLFGIWIIKNDSIGSNVVYRFCGTNTRQCFTMSYITTNVFGVPGKMYGQVEGQNFGFRGEYTLMEDGIHVEVTDMEGDPIENVPDSSFVSLWKPGMQMVLDVNHAHKDRVGISVAKPKSAAFPPLWEMLWIADDPYLPRPMSAAKKASLQKRPSRISVQRKEGMKSGDKGRVSLPDGRVVEYTVPSGSESHFIVAF